MSDSDPDDIYTLRKPKPIQYFANSEHIRKASFTESDNEDINFEFNNVKRNLTHLSSITPVKLTVISDSDDSDYSDLDGSASKNAKCTELANSSSEDISDMELKLENTPDYLKKKIAGCKRRKNGTNKVLKKLANMQKIPIVRNEISVDDILNQSESFSVPEDLTITLKVIFIDGHRRFKVDKTKHLFYLVQEISDYKKVNPSQIKLVLGDILLDINKSPDDLHLDITSLIECTILSATNANKEFKNPLEIRISIQDNKVSNRNKRTVINICINEKLCVLFEKYAKLRNLNSSQLKFYFDGEILNPSQTLEENELEDNFCIDVKT